MSSFQRMTELNIIHIHNVPFRHHRAWKFKCYTQYCMPYQTIATNRSNRLQWNTVMMKRHFSSNLLAILQFTENKNINNSPIKFDLFIKYPFVFGITYSPSIYFCSIRVVTTEKRVREREKDGKLVTGTKLRKKNATIPVYNNNNLWFILHCLPPVKLSWKFVLHAFSSSTSINNLIKCLYFAHRFLLSLLFFSPFEDFLPFDYHHP